MMTKAHFLDTREVKNFVSYLVRLWSKGFDFRLSIYRRGKVLEYKDMKSIKEAVYPNYLWEYSIKTAHVLPAGIKAKGSSYQDSNDLIGYCKKKIRNNKGLNNLKDLRTGLEIVLRWGGAFYKGNRAFVQGNDHEIRHRMTKVIQLWDDLNSSGDLLDHVSSYCIKCNAGFTKIYSVLLDGFIIYDSRVATALAYLLQERFGANIPESLRLYIPPSRVKDKSKRSISDNFDTNGNNPDLRYFLSNVKASWILEAVAKKVKADISVRDIEAALFMIGYDIRPAKKKINIAVKK